jgi:hypothetical protein
MCLDSSHAFHLRLSLFLSSTYSSYALISRYPTVLGLRGSLGGPDKVEDVLGEQDGQDGELPVLVVVASLEGNDLVGRALVLRHA